MTPFSMTVFINAAHTLGAEDTLKRNPVSCSLFRHTFANPEAAPHNACEWIF